MYMLTSFTAYLGAFEPGRDVVEDRAVVVKLEVMQRIQPE
jgi:hypothetical protein